MMEKEKTDSKRIQINFRLTEIEDKRLKLNAFRAGLTPSMYAKKMAIEGKVRPQLIDPESAKEITSQLAKIGSNVNQIAKKVNSGNTAEKEAIVAIVSSLNDLWDYILNGKKPKDRKLTEKKEKEGDENGVCKGDGKSQIDSRVAVR